MLADTTDICRVIGNINIDEKDIFLHPATYVHKKHEQQHTKTNRMDDIKLQNRIMLWRSVVPQERMFCRPALGDDGGMSSDLLDLWTRNCARTVPTLLVVDVHARCIPGRLPFPIYCKWHRKHDG